VNDNEHEWLMRQSPTWACECMSNCVALIMNE